MQDEFRSVNILSTRIGEGPFEMLISIELTPQAKWKTTAVGGDNNEITSDSFDTYPEAKALYEKCIAIKLAQFTNMTGLAL
ncbi:MAG: hypothetical protein PHY47_00745 [Lachnospiraceae bacterium]|nr:hypothetical protein [Lachnospiraceae bacterium]